MFLFFKQNKLNLISGASGDLRNEVTVTQQSSKDNLDTTSPSCTATRSFSLCIYVAVGFSVGITFVLVAGGVVICCIKIRQRQLAGPRKTRLRTRKGRFQCRLKNSKDNYRDTGGIEEQISSGLPGEISSPLSQSSWYDSETESVNRNIRCQKCGAMVSTSTLDKLPEKRVNSSTAQTHQVDFTWKGLIEGTEEVINTELRAPPGGQEPHLPTFFDSEALFSKYSEAQELQCSSEAYQVLTTAEIESGNRDALVTL